jgi:arabinose-5-phosphate isomerase
MGKPSRVFLTLRRVLALEAEALRKTRAAVDERFERAVRAVAACRGKVIVTGMGKSGLVAQKIAATLSSTGTPAFYLHPGEAMHGDLGMVEKRDLILAVGKSGESSELTAILPSLRKIGVKVVAMTTRARSTLARASHALILLPVEAEACPLNLAPTCSTTAMLAAGDALAVALMELRGFRREHFARLHPGGPLGKRLTLRVLDVMRSGKDNPVVRSNAPVSRLLLEITKKQAGAANVVDARGRLVGLVTDFDIRRALRALPAGRNLFSLSVPQIMNPKPTSIQAGRMAFDAVGIMTGRKNPFNVLPVVDGRGRSVGLILVHDLRARGL